MQIVKEDKVPVETAPLLCRQSRLHTAVTEGAVAALLIAVGPVWRMLGAPVVVWAGCMVLALLVVPPLAMGVVALFKRSNWILAADKNRLWVNTRSYRHQHLSGSPVVIQFQKKEITAVSSFWDTTETEGTRLSPATREKTGYLQLHISQEGISKIKQMLQAEKERQAAAKKLGMLGSRTTSQHNPVKIDERGLLCIAWRGGKDNHVMPAIEQTQNCLKELLEVRLKKT